MYKTIFILLLSILSVGDNTSSKETSAPPLEIYIIDQKIMPKATGIEGTSYTATVFIVNNVTKKVIGPFKGSSFPNSKEIPKDSDKPNTIVVGPHLFNNKYGHKGGTKKGLNLINKLGVREVKGFSWSKRPSEVFYANVHAGFSDKGNFNSRGSMGCITIQPKEVNAFWKHFDFSKKTKGTSTGVVYIFRNNLEKRKKLIAQIKNLYKNK